MARAGGIVVGSRAKLRLLSTKKLTMVVICCVLRRVKAVIEGFGALSVSRGSPCAGPYGWRKDL